MHGCRQHRSERRGPPDPGRGARRVRRPAVGPSGPRTGPAPGLIGGRDLQAGGTWLAVDPGRPGGSAPCSTGTACPPPSATRRSRGDLPLLAAAAGELPPSRPGPLRPLPPARRRSRRGPPVAAGTGSAAAGRAPDGDPHDRQQRLGARSGERARRLLPAPVRQGRTAPRRSTDPATVLGGVARAGHRRGAPRRRPPRPDRPARAARRAGLRALCRSPCSPWPPAGCTTSSPVIPATRRLSTVFPRNDPASSGG